MRSYASSPWGWGKFWCFYMMDYSEIKEKKKHYWLKQYDWISKILWYMKEYESVHTVGFIYVECKNKQN